MTTLLHLTTTSVNPDWLCHQLDASVAAGYDVAVASPPAGASAAEDAQGWSRRGIAHYPLATADLRAALQLRSLLNVLKPDIVHTHTPKSAMVGRVMARLVEGSIVVNSANSFEPRQSGFARRAAVTGVERFASAYRDAEVVHRTEDVEKLVALDVPRDDIYMVGNGIHLPSFMPSRAGSRSARCRLIQMGISLSTTVVGMVDRDAVERDYDAFFAAVDRVRHDMSTDKVAFVIATQLRKDQGIAGRATLRRRAEERGVHLLDAGDDRSTLFPMIDVLVLPSPGDDTDCLAMEASAMCVPVVAGDAHAFRQVIDHEETGLLVRRGRSQDLADEIARLVNDPVLRSRMGRSARAKAFDDFDQTRVVDATLAVYEDQLLRKRLPIPVPPRTSVQVPQPEVQVEPVEERPWYLDSIDLVERERVDIDEIDLTGDTVTSEAQRTA